MPNYYDNVLTASGDEKEIAKLKSRASGKDDDGKDVPFQFKSFFPVPCGLDHVSSVKITDENRAKSVRWYMSNWGARGDAFNVEITLDGKTKVAYSYSTASSPGETFAENVSRKFPILEFDLEYISLDAGLKGRITYRNGIAKNS